MVSVIVLTYNHEKYIRQALDSILMQKVDFKYEILVGDDCSTDGTPEILLEYQNRYPDIFCIRLRRKNIGATKNAYELLSMAKGNYIAACEGDDYWIDSNKLKIQVDFLEKNTTFIGCAHDCLIVDDNGVPYKKQRLSWVTSKKIYTLKNFKGIVLPGQAATIVRRNLYKNNQDNYEIFYKAHKHIGDRTTILIYASQGDFFHFKDKMSAYRRGTSNIGLTETIYNKKRNWILEDLEFTERLLTYSQKKLGVNANFRNHKMQLFTSAFCNYLKRRTRDDFLVMKKILLTEKRRFWGYYFFYLPFGIYKKIKEKICCFN